MHKRRKVSHFLPIWIEAMLPIRLHSLFKGRLESENKTLVARESSYFKPGKEAQFLATTGRAEVMLHLFDGFSAFGHMDFAFDDKVISYGCYDVTAHRLFDTVSDGVLAVADRQPYIDYCLRQEKKFLIGYQLLLTPAQEQLICDKIRTYRGNLISWESAYRRALADKLQETAFDDPASLLQQHVNTEFYKFQRGKFKTYFSFNTNCAMLIDDIMGVLGGASIAPPGGIITPGAGYRYFETLLARHDSIVAGREVYL